VFKGGREVHLPFVLGARYLHLDVQYDLTRFVEAVEAAGGIAEARLGRGTVHKSEMRSVYSVGAALIQNDWFAFLAKPPEFPPGVVPNDGFTGTAENLEQAPANLIGYYL
jgi:hypothetical protein